MNDTAQTQSATLSARRRMLDEAVAKRVIELQNKSTDEATRYPDVAGRLARLRRGINAEPGSEPAIWADTIGALPEDLWSSTDEPSSWEWAAHSAITLFALHAQGSTTAVHRHGTSLGAAVRRLAGARSAERGKQDPAVFRRFQTLATASSGEELNYHLRSMITLMRGEGIQLDYGQLAVDIHDLASPRSADRVRLRWGRDYHRTTSDPDASDANESESQ